MRRLIRFRTRSMLIALTVICGFVAVGSNIVYQHQQEQMLADSLLAMAESEHTNRNQSSDPNKSTWTISRGSKSGFG